MFSYINQEAKKNYWTPRENNLMHYIHSGVKYYKEYPSKATISKDDKKCEIIEAVQTIYSNNQKLNELDLEMCLELIEGPLVSQCLDYALAYNNLGQNSMKNKNVRAKERRYFCCF